MLFGAGQTREDLRHLLSTSEQTFEDVVAMACVGMAFTNISNFESYVGSLIAISKVKLKTRLSAEALEKSQLLLQRHEQVLSSTLGKLVGAIEDSGIEGRDIRYLREIVNLRNEFVHRFTHKVPLPGDWKRYGFTLERFLKYPQYVLKHTAIAHGNFSRIMVRYGLLSGQFGEFGAFLWNPDDPLFGENH